MAERQDQKTTNAVETSRINYSARVKIRKISNYRLAKNNDEKGKPNRVSEKHKRERGSKEEKGRVIEEEIGEVRKIEAT